MVEGAPQPADRRRLESVDWMQGSRLEAVCRAAVGWVEAGEAVVGWMGSGEAVVDCSALDDDGGGSAAGAVGSGWTPKTYGASTSNKCTSGWG